MPKIKLGQIGVGHAHAAGTMAAYRAGLDFEVVGVVEPDGELRRKAEGQAEYRDLPWMTREQLLNHPGLQVVAVETRIRDSLGSAQDCIAAGMHVHLDKPPGDSLPRFKKLLADAAMKHLTVQPGYMFRYNPAIVLLRKLLADGLLGEPFELHAVMSKVVTPESRRTFAEFSGGIMFELGCHVVDLVVMVLGKPQSMSTFHRTSDAGSEGLADNMLAVAEYPQATATIRSTALEVEGFARRQLTVCGREGTAHIQPLDAPNMLLALAKPSGEYRSGYQEIKFGDYPRYVGDAADLARIIRGEKDPDFSYEHELAVQETVLRASKMPVE